MISRVNDQATFEEKNAELDYDVLIIGAGLSGIYSVHRMTSLGLRARVLEAGSDVGGTWFWNRYPGARFDSESYTYNFFFSQELVDEWKWSEHFSGQAETLRYINFLCDRLNLKQHMQFNTRIISAHWQADKYWLLTDENHCQYTSRYLITAIGILNEYTLPNIPGVYDFKGETFHTARWPQEAVDLSNKRVAVLGTGATGVSSVCMLFSHNN